MKTLELTRFELIVVCLVSAVFFLAAQPNGTTWKVCGTSGKSSGSAAGVGGDVATISLNAHPKPAFLTTVSDSSLLGNLTGSTISAAVSVTVESGNPDFTFGGEGSSINPCNNPPAVRLYFSTNPKPFNLSVSQSHEDGYWWSNPVHAEVNASLNTVLTESLDPTRWSNANGHRGDARLAGFTAAIANVRQIGVSFGGGCFFDVGVGVVSGTGTATFHLESYTVTQ